MLPIFETVQTLVSYFIYNLFFQRRAFASTEVMESHVAIASGKLFDLSTEQVQHSTVYACILTHLLLMYTHCTYYTVLHYRLRCAPLTLIPAVELVAASVPPLSWPLST